MLMLIEGATFAGKYSVQCKLGEGGMGSVYRATNTLTGKQVALKFLPPELTEDREAVARLLREARVLSRFDHPNVVDVYDVLFDAGRAFLVLADHRAAREFHRRHVARHMWRCDDLTLQL
jgi:serine/threonine-protein kinase